MFATFKQLICSLEWNFENFKKLIVKNVVLLFFYGCTLFVCSCLMNERNMYKIFIGLKVYLIKKKKKLPK